MGNLDIEAGTGKTPCQDKGIDWGAGSTSQGMPIIASKPSKAGRESQRYSFRTLRRNQAYGCLIFDF